MESGPFHGSGAGPWKATSILRNRSCWAAEIVEDLNAALEAFQAIVVRGRRRKIGSIGLAHTALDLPRALALCLALLSPLAHMMAANAAGAMATARRWPIDSYLELFSGWRGSICASESRPISLHTPTQDRGFSVDGECTAALSLMLRRCPKGGWTGLRCTPGSPNAQQWAGRPVETRSPPTP